jgi:hypothetical protein
VSDPKAITALFEKAAAKGSMDAKILLALQLASDDALPGRLDDSPGHRAKTWAHGSKGWRNFWPWFRGHAACADWSCTKVGLAPAIAP